jgi:hypothetical protein
MVPTLGAQDFGIDFWVATLDSWRAVFSLLDEDRVGLGLVGFQVGWERIEPAAPSAGIHSYQWATLDPLFEAAFASGRLSVSQIDMSDPPFIVTPVKNGGE